jgi:hypothetical protein
MASSDNTPPLDVRQRVESDDDLDLLTYNEARVRLSEEVVAEQHLCDELARLASCGPDPAAADRAEASPTPTNSMGRTCCGVIPPTELALFAYRRGELYG